MTWTMGLLIWAAVSVAWGAGVAGGVWWVRRRRRGPKQIHVEFPAEAEMRSDFDDDTRLRFEESSPLRIMEHLDEDSLRLVARYNAKEVLKAYAAAAQDDTSLHAEAVRALHDAVRELRERVEEIDPGAGINLSQLYARLTETHSMTVRRLAALEAKSADEAASQKHINTKHINTKSTYRGTFRGLGVWRGPDKPDLTFESYETGPRPTCETCRDHLGRPEMPRVKQVVKEDADRSGAIADTLWACAHKRVWETRRWAFITTCRNDGPTTTEPVLCEEERREERIAR